MKDSITSISPVKKIAIGAVWLILWQIVAMLLDNEVFLPTPGAVAVRLFELFALPSFWPALFNSMWKIILGFLGAIIAAVILAALASVYSFVFHFLNPAMNVIKSIPVASFIILALVFVKSYWLSVLASFVMVLPMVYYGVYSGIINVDKKLLEMAEVFKVPVFKRIKNIYVPSVMPHFLSAATVGLGFAWKSGIAAEIIGLPNDSIGINIYNAKINLLIPDLFAWTVILILLSILVEKGFKMLIGAVSRGY